MSKEVSQEYQAELLKHLASAFNIESQTNVENINKAADLIREGYLPILVSNHQSHADGIAHALIIKRLVQQSNGAINGFYLPIAASIETGHQGHDLQKLITDQKPLLSKLGLNMIAVTREKDYAQYGIPLNKENIVRLAKSASENYGMVCLPEGSVQGGRTNPETNKIYGMSRPESLGAFDLVIRGCKKCDRPYFVLPVGIDGSYKIVSPDHSKNGNQIDEFKTEKILQFIKVEDKANIKVGSPIFASTYDSYENKVDGLLTEVAKLLPVDAQGVYAGSCRVDLDQL